MRSIILTGLAGIVLGLTIVALVAHMRRQAQLRREIVALLRQRGCIK